MAWLAIRNAITQYRMQISINNNNKFRQARFASFKLVFYMLNAFCVFVCCLFNIKCNLMQHNAKKMDL